MKHKASYVINKIFDVVCAREEQSKNAILDVCKIKKQMVVTPDIANLMKYDNVEYGQNNRIAITVSHQLERQWKSQDDYCQCIVALINHIIKTLPEYEIIIIPNETSPVKKNNDIDIAYKIAQNITLNNNIRILADADFDAVEMKNLIASCDIMISARYHSCVAALSSTVPTLAMGWHYKYDELLELYGQTKCIVSGENCSTYDIVKKFDYIWDNKEKIHKGLCVSFCNVEKELFEKYKRIFVVEENR